MKNIPFTHLGEIYKKKEAFSLAEVLITLAIMGVIAVLVVPSMLMQHQKTVYINGYKKITASLSEAIAKSIADDGKDASNWFEAKDNAGNFRYSGDNKKFSKFLEYNLTVKKVDTTTGDVYFADGTTIKGVAGLTAGCGAVGNANSPCLIVVDTNGQMGPNELTTCEVVGNDCKDGTLKVYDQFYVILAGEDVIPLDVEQVIVGGNASFLTALSVSTVTTNNKGTSASSIGKSYIYATRKALGK